VANIVLQKLQTLTWFIRRPPFWRHMLALIGRKFDGSAAAETFRTEAREWAAKRASEIDQVLQELGLPGDGERRDRGVPEDLLGAASKRVERSGVKMGGPGDLDLIHRAILALGARRVIETGVAHGWSSLAALAALKRTGGRLVSVDMPYPKEGKEAYVGLAVPAELKPGWTLLRLPDRNGIKKAIALVGGEVDLVHYDSDKSYPGRAWAYPILWAALRPGGLFISDDIQDNFAFRDFMEQLSEPYAVVECNGKYVGIVRKPLARTNPAS
jgi:predicted O-methyltransferase YrrM